jgi:hypothetical protein
MLLLLSFNAFWLRFRILATQSGLVLRHLALASCCGFVPTVLRLSLVAATPVAARILSWLSFDVAFVRPKVASCGGVSHLHHVVAQLWSVLACVSRPASCGSKWLHVATSLTSIVWFANVVMSTVDVTSGITGW